MSLLYHLAQHCKTVRDKEGHTYSEARRTLHSKSKFPLKRFAQNLYLLSELVDYAIKQRAKNNGWTIPSYPDKINMPNDIFSPLPTAAALKEVRSTVYLTDEKIGWLGELGKAVRSPQAKVRAKLIGKRPAYCTIDQKEESSSCLKVKVSSGVILGHTVPNVHEGGPPRDARRMSVTMRTMRRSQVMRKRSTPQSPNRQHQPRTGTCLKEMTARWKEAVKRLRSVEEHADEPRFASSLSWFSLS